MEGTKPEVELLRERNVRVTSQAAQVGRNLTPISALRRTILTEKPVQRRIAPMLMIVVGPLLAIALLWATGWVLASILAGLGLIIVGAALYRERTVHEVHGHFRDGDSRMLLRTASREHAARLHAALGRAVALTDLTLARVTHSSPDGA
jgi:hypothetical protein